MTDTLSDVLRLIRLKSCVYFARDFRAPWGMGMDGGTFAQFHAVLRGNCVVTHAGRYMSGSAGDVFLFPTGDAHQIADAPDRAAVPGPTFMESLATDTPLFMDGGAPTRLLCGHYEYRNDIRHPLIDELAPVIHIRSFDDQAPETLNGVLPMLARELSDARPGATAVAEKLAEILLVQVIRAHFEQARHRGGVIAGLLDPRLSKAFTLVHNAYARHLTLDDLAAAAGISRSAFAAHFREHAGMTPVAYLAVWRMCIAFELLTSDRLPVAEAALRVGYDSDIAFGRAFKRHFGQTPGVVRRRASISA
ncbi:MAG: AraC family transcriptional regulator [Rhodospirillaceae bacterium]|jgi:AraC-like DNA-binding protein|nr:AraC family transcriptional regulator [Rhodospirillaceae bacterium]MBT5945016.1 AraC family transcriptional regulator [Rhodospirillaceae bacterium]MBT6402903.1 AraC family transcriptional regulator [Rhodospirillaceae bacterium]MBT6535795.1 AraC family transcriptional regulator [Rhodospirillaceae bacterium]